MGDLWLVEGLWKDHMKKIMNVENEWDQMA